MAILKKLREKGIVIKSVDLDNGKALGEHCEVVGRVFGIPVIKKSPLYEGGRNSVSSPRVRKSHSPKM